MFVEIAEGPLRDWETPGQRGDWAAAAMVPLFESGTPAGVTTNPSPVTPIDGYVRSPGGVSR